MKNIAIITIYGNENYGNKFQNYAVKKLIENDENVVYTINRKKTVKQVLALYMRKIGLYKYKQDSFDKKKMKNFKKFSDEYLNVVNQYNLKKMNSNFDMFYVGSDQVWNTNGFKNKTLEYHLLSFTAPEKRIAISPSLGIGMINDDQKKYFINEIPKFKMLSCRETSNKCVIEEFSNGKVCTKLPDPTIGLTKDQWDLIRKKADSKPNNKYIFTYLLGQKSNEIQELVNIFEDKEIVEIMKKDDINLFSNNPGQFLDLLDDSELIITDSFHGCVFSIIYNKPFVVVHTPDRINMEDRIKSLLLEFNLENRLIENIDIDNIYTIDYSDCNIILEEQRRKLIHYIDESLK